MKFWSPVLICGLLVDFVYVKGPHLGALIFQVWSCHFMLVTLDNFGITATGTGATLCNL